MLGGALARAAVQLFNEKAEGAGLAALTYMQLQHRQYVQHSNSDMSPEAVQYCATRPAFVGIDDENTHVLYLWKASGLHLQHAHQVVLIARCEAFLVAAALLKAATACLGVGLRPDRVRVWGAVNADTCGAWHTACREFGLYQDEWPKQPTIRELLEKKPANDRTRAMLHRAARTTDSEWPGVGCLPK